MTGTVGTSSAGTFSCTAQAANPTAARSEGYAELLGDIVITCTGGNLLADGAPVPTANITVALNNTVVTSRVFSNGLSEALLLIDDPGATGGTTGPGASLGQQLCQATNGTGFGGCGATYANNRTTNAAGLPNSQAAFCTGTIDASGNCVASGGNRFGNVPNVFQGQVSNNQVIFNGIPILAPVTSGLARTYRITNIRGNAAQFAGQAGTFQGQIPILASITVSSYVNLTNPVVTTAFLFNGLGSTVVRNQTNTGTGSSALNLLQCNTAGITGGAVLRFPEGFANAFKTRVSPTTTYSGVGAATAGQGIPTLAQNVPGAIYNGSESGFIYSVGSNTTAGLADFGTRLKATFSNVPSNVNLYVSTTNLPLLNNGNLGHSLNNNTSLNTGAFVSLLSNVPSFTNNSVLNGNLLAGLVTSEFSGATALGGFVSLQSGTNNNFGVNLYGPLTVDSTGTATAVWEILTANPNAFETAEFGVFYSYTGNPATNTPPTSPATTVAMSFAPTYGTPSGGSLIPRFTPPGNSTSVMSFVLCQTTLLYPFVSAEPGFDTGIAIANTTNDSFGTRNQSGTCTLSFWGSGQGTTNTVTTASIAAGQVYTDQASNLKNGFKGYVIAVCNFQLAHGYALFSDTGIRNWATGYLALVLPTGVNARNGQAISYNPNTGGVEGTIH